MDHSLRIKGKQQKTQRPVQFEITGQTREAVIVWSHRQGLECDDFTLRTPPLRTSFAPASR